MIPASSVATCARRSIGTAASGAAGEGACGTTGSVHCDQACIQAVIPRRRNNASPNPSLPACQPQVASRRSCSYCSVTSRVDRSRTPDSFSGVFFGAQQGAFDTAGMNFGSEPLLDPAHQLRGLHGRLVLAYLDQEGQDLVGQLVRLLGAAFVGHQAGEP